MIKLIACDVDGTLLDNDGSLSDRNKKALMQATKEEVQCVICTGRNSFEVQLLYDELELEIDAICLNGALTMNHADKTLSSHYIDDEMLTILNEFASNNEILIEYHCENKTYLPFSREDLYQQFCIYEKREPECEETRKLFNRFWYYSDDCYDKSIQFIKEKKVIKAEFLYIPDEKYQSLYNQLCCLDVNVTTSTFLNNIEINDKMTSKGMALKEYCDCKGILNNEVVVIGDSINDKSMFEMFENSVAVSNACDEIKKIAKYQTKGNDESGVAIVIENVLKHNQKVDDTEKNF